MNADNNAELCKCFRGIPKDRLTLISAFICVYLRPCRLQRVEGGGCRAPDLQEVACGLIQPQKNADKRRTGASAFG